MLFPFCKAKLLTTVTKIKPRGQKSPTRCHGNSWTVPLTDLWKQPLQQDFTALALRFSKLFMQLMREMQPTLYTQFKSTCWWYKKECWTTGLLHLLQNYQHTLWGVYSWTVNGTVWGVRSAHELWFDPMPVQRADLTSCLVIWYFRNAAGLFVSTRLLQVAVRWEPWAQRAGQAAALGLGSLCWFICHVLCSKRSSCWTAF